MSEQDKLKIQLEEKLERVEELKFDPIKGHPYLHWRGKKPFKSTQYFPAQLKEVYGKTYNNWINKVFWGDNIQVMSHLLKQYRNKVNLVYIDPPFDSNADYKKRIQLKGHKVENDYNVFEEKQYSDIWTNDDYIQFMYERIILLRELIAKNGSIYVHCDYRVNSFLRIIMDEIFGPNNYKNEICWKRHAPTGAKAISNQFARNTDTILFYIKSEKYTWNNAYKPYSKKFIKEKFRPNKEGRLFRDSDLGMYSELSIEEFEKKGKIYTTRNGNKRLIRFLDEEKGEAISTIWDDIKEVNSQAKERVNYPTQKPEALIERIIKASSNPGDIVFDCFMGSGTTQAVAMKLGRRFIGADINLGAIQTTTDRLIKVAKDIEENGQTEIDNDDEIDTHYKGFEVYNVNNYDLFRNQLEAKELLIEALEIQPLSRGGIYDGEKDGRMVKIMPINRIASKADLSELITGFDYKSFELKKSENINKPVEKLLLVCMGHEPDLAATLENNTGYRLDVEVVDILRDRSELEFKRDSEAKITVNDGNLVIEGFYPMNLLQKLSIMKEDGPKWKELVNSVMIDWNYDGNVMKPDEIDLPKKNEFVEGKYKLPKKINTIKVKITDLLSESFEIELKNA